MAFDGGRSKVVLSEKPNKSKGLPILFANMKMSINPTIMRFHASLFERVKGVIPSRPLKEMFRIYARRVIAAVAGKLPFFERPVVEFVAKTARHCVFTTNLYSPVPLTGYGPSPQPASLRAIDVGVEIGNRIDRHSRVGTLLRAVFLSVVVAGKHALERGLANLTLFSHFTNYNAYITGGTTRAGYNFAEAL